MRIDIITIFPDFLKNFFNYSILKRAQENNSIEINIHNLREYSKNKQKSVDDINLEEEQVWYYVYNQLTTALQN